MEKIRNVFPVAKWETIISIHQHHYILLHCFSSGSPYRFITITHRQLLLLRVTGLFSCMEYEWLHSKEMHTTENHCSCVPIAMLWLLLMLLRRLDWWGPKKFHRNESDKGRWLPIYTQKKAYPKECPLGAIIKNNTLFREVLFSLRGQGSGWCISTFGNEPP